MTEERTTVRIGTRGSALALWQADHVTGLLRAAHPRIEVERVVIHTKGDRILDQPLARIGDRGLFTKELEHALLEGTVDLVVHSMKDVPTETVPGLALAAVPPRGPAGDAFVSPRFARLDDLPPGATVATGSLRREAQLRHARPDLRIVGVRGNVATRLRKLDEHGWDAMILAVAGLERLGLGDRVAERLDLARFVPAVGQGALYLQVREGSRAASIAAAIDDPETAAAVGAERRFMAALQGGCQVPIGAFASARGRTLHIVGFVARRDGSDLVRREATGPSSDPEALGQTLADAVIAAGGAEVLRDERREGPAFAPPTRAARLGKDETCERQDGEDEEEGA